MSAVAKGVTEDGRRSVHPEWYNRAHLCVMVDPERDHAPRWLWAIDDREEVTCESHIVISEEELNDDAAEEVEPPAAS